MHARAASLIRFLVVTTLIGAVVVVSASPASAHAGKSAVEASNYKTTFSDITPSHKGINARIVGNDGEISLKNTTTEDVVILGYAKEPYMRVNSSGTFLNPLSPSIEINSRPGMIDPQTVKTNTTSQPEVEWVKVSDSNTAEWRDHRITWIPEAERIANGDKPSSKRALIPNWVIPVTIEGDAASINGSLTWVPPPNGTIKYIAIAALATTTVALGMRSKRWVLAFALAAVIVINFMHTWMIAASHHDGIGVVWGIVSNIDSMAAWITGLFAITKLVRASRLDEAIFYALFAAGTLLIVDVLGQESVFRYSQLDLPGPPELTRWLTAITGGLGLGVLVLCLAQLIRQSQQTSVSVEAPESGP